MNRSTIDHLEVLATNAKILDKPDKTQQKMNGDFFEFALNHAAEIVAWCRDADRDMDRYSSARLK